MATLPVLHAWLAITWALTLHVKSVTPLYNFVQCVPHLLFALDAFLALL